MSMSASVNEQKEMSKNNAQKTRINIKEVFEFLSGENEYLFVCTLKGQYAELMTPEQVLHTIKVKSNEHLFFFPSVMKKEEINGKVVCRRTQDAVEKVQFVFADLDIFENVTEDVSLPCFQETVERLKNAGLPKPNLVTYTGRGIHILYKIEPSDNFELFRAVQKKLSEVLNSDPAVINPNRILRLPYSINYKYGVKTKVLYFNKDVKYTLEYFQNKLDVTVNEKPEITERKIYSVENIYKHVECENTEQVVDAKKRIMDRIYGIISPYYIKGYRNNIMLHLVAMLLKRDVVPDDIIYLFERLTEDDEEKRQRFAQTVERQIKKACIEECDLNGFSGATGLENILTGLLLENGMTVEKAQKKAHSIIIQIHSVLDEYKREYIPLTQNLSFVITEKNILLEYADDKGNFVEETLCPVPLKIIYYDENTSTVTIATNDDIYAIEECKLVDMLPYIVESANYFLLTSFIQAMARRLYSSFL